jgi:hypothetical protein
MEILEARKMLNGKNTNGIHQFASYNGRAQFTLLFSGVMHPLAAPAAVARYTPGTRAMRATWCLHRASSSVISHSQTSPETEVCESTGDSP